MFFRTLKWYAINEVDQKLIYTPTLKILAAKSIQRTRNYGAKDQDYFWFLYPNSIIEYQQALKVTIYCSFNFQSFPFDNHICDVKFGGIGNLKRALIQNATIVGYKDKNINYGEGFLHVKQSRLPFSISLESLKPFDHYEIGFNYSYAGMRIHFSRNSIGQLLGGYYGPTMIFALISLVSFSINVDMVS